MTHARLAIAVREAGPAFLLAPSHYVAAQGAWTKPAYGSGAARLPYAIGFHVLVAPLPVDYDGLLEAIKLLGAALSVVPLLLVWAMARRFGLSPLAALLMFLIPTYTSRLSFALMPALLGHALDMTLLLWLALHLDRLQERRVWWTGVGLVSLAQVAYVSSVTHTVLFLPLFALAIAWEERRPRTAALLLGLGLAGSGLSVILYYRDFLVSAVAALGSGGPSQYPVVGWLALTYARSRDFFGWSYPPLALVGLAVLLRRRSGRALWLAWAATYLALLLLRAKVPDIFRYGHETLFVTPLVCLAAGACLDVLWTAGGWRRAVGAALVLGLAADGLVRQAQAIADQLANAL
jgi:hypothetical protein